MVRTKEDLDRYIDNIRDALRYPGAKYLYFPLDKKDRKTGNIRFARELGHGLKDFDPKDITQIVGNLYSMLIVANSFDSCGVQINNTEFIYHLNLVCQSEGTPSEGGL